MPEAFSPTIFCRIFGRGWLTRRTVVIPGWKGWLLILVVFGIAGYGAVMGVYGFLAADEPVSSEILVVEAWVADHALLEGLDRSRDPGCRLMLLAGGTVRAEIDRDPGDTYARKAMQSLKRVSNQLEKVREVGWEIPDRDRTFGSAIAVRDWLRDEGIATRAINVLTVGPHARRSRLMFEEAFGPDVKVGIISVPSKEYDPEHWWRSSEGVKEVLSEGAAYFYARFLFRKP